MPHSKRYRNRRLFACLQSTPLLLGQYFVVTMFLSSFIPVSHTLASIDHLEGEAGFRMASLHWKFSLDTTQEKQTPSFRIRYCEVQTWGLHRCRYQVQESNSSRIGRQEGVGSVAEVFAEIGGLRMATNYSFQVVPQEAGVKAGRPSQIALQTKGFSAKATKCLADASEVAIETGPFFGGRISVDESEVPGCFISGDPTSPQTQYIMTIKHQACGSQVNGSKVTTVILVQENLPILTHSTRKFVVLCSFSPESFIVKTGVTLPRDTSVAKSIDFSGIIRLSPQGTNLLIANKEQLPRRGSVRDSSLGIPQQQQFTTVVDESELATNDNTLRELSSKPSPKAIFQIESSHPMAQLDSRRQSRAFFQTHESLTSVPSAAAAVQNERTGSGHSSNTGGLQHSGWEGFLVLGLVSMGIVASVSSLIWFVKSYRTGPPSRSEDGLSESSSVTDDEGPYSISSIEQGKGQSALEFPPGHHGRTPHNLDTRSEFEVELDFEFSEERNTSLILRQNQPS